jgi:short-subunit dehydrogenase
MNNSIEMQGRHVLVTGGAHGIGLAITEAFVAAGAAVHVCDIDTSLLASLQERLPAVRQSVADVSDERQVDAMFTDLVSRWGTLDALVNNAGIPGPTCAIEDTSIADWEKTIAVNLTGHFLCARRAVPMLKAAGGGSIVNMSSAAGRMGFPLRTAYSASKFGIAGLTATWAMELGPVGIRVNSILPGMVAGERQERMMAIKARSYGIAQEELRQRMLGKVSLRSMVSPQDIANQVLFICSPAGAAISGQNLSVCGNLEHLG